MDSKNRKFKIEIFIIAFVAITILTVISLLAAWARDEGQLTEGDGLIKNLLADSFSFFRQPAHGLFWDTISKNSSSWFLPTLTFNILFWTILTERLIVWITRLIRTMRLKSNANNAYKLWPGLG